MTDHPIPPPEERVSPALLDKLRSGVDLGFDVHVHSFTRQHVPNRFLGFPLPHSRVFFARMSHALRALVYRDGDSLDHLSYFLNMLNSSAATITDRALSYYAYDRHTGGADTVICALSMDLTPGVRGRFDVDLDGQLDELLDVANERAEQVIPFLAVDPNRRTGRGGRKGGPIDLVADLLVPWFARDAAAPDRLRFFGVKLYPSLGYLPSHPRLMPVYELCERHHIPIVTHCSGAAVRTTRRLMRVHGIDRRTGEPTKRRRLFRTPSQYARVFNHPRNWEPVLERYPDLHLNLAHFGGPEEWSARIGGKPNRWPDEVMYLIERFDNVYTDISGYTLYAPGFADYVGSLLRDNSRLRERVLFGSDYYMTVRKGHFRSLKTSVEATLGDQLMRQIARVNPRRYLFLPELE